MRNSVMPMVLVVVVAVIGVYAMRSESKPGLNGPDLHPGIFRLPKQDKFHVDSAALEVRNDVTVEGEPPANRGESWRVVQLQAEDRHPLTRATVLGLAENLAAHGCVALVAPVDTVPFPMGVSRVISVATPMAEIPAMLGGDASATVQVRCRLARLPVGHPAASLLPDPAGSLRCTLTIAHHTHSTAAPAGWPNWWAGAGRALATTVLERLAPGGVAAVVDPATRTWLPTLMPLSDWGSALPQAPTTERLYWQYAFQEPLVRGWIGLVPGMTTTTKSGAEEPTLDQLVRRMRAGGWESAGAEGTHLYTRTHDGRSEWFSISPAEGAIGWTTTWWQERPGMGDLFATWAGDAAKGDVTAQRLLYTHRECANLPKELHEAAQRVPDGAPR